MRLTMLVLCAAVVSVACAAELRPAEQRSAPPRLTRLPAPPLQTPRQAAAAHATLLSGAEFAERSPGAATDGDKLLLLAAPGELTWAYYELPTNGFPVLGVEAALDIVSGAAWVGLS